jgi:hypothetical protein
VVNAAPGELSQSSALAISSGNRHEHSLVLEGFSWFADLLWDSFFVLDLLVCDLQAQLSCQQMHWIKTLYHSILASRSGTEGGAKFRTFRDSSENWSTTTFCSLCVGFACKIWSVAFFSLWNSLIWA